MLPFQKPVTASDAGEALTTLTDAAWVLAALVRICGTDARSWPTTDAAAALLAAAGLFVREDDRYVPSPGIQALMDESSARFEAARSVIGQVGTVTRGGTLGRGWAEQDDDTLVAQGEASGRFVDLMLPVVEQQAPGLRECLSRPGAALLDIGSGVGALACAFAEAFPSLSVVGVDPFDRVHRLAERRAAERGVQGRVSFRAHGVEDLNDNGDFDVAWVPAPFIPRPAFTAGVPALYRALRPAGWLLVGMGRLLDEGVSSAVTRWQTELIGGTPLTPDEADQILSAAGFVDIVTVATPPGAPVVVTARRPASPPP
jgi:SAM-dependent methyltransferase